MRQIPSIPAISRYGFRAFTLAGVVMLGLFGIVASGGGGGDDGGGGGSTPGTLQFSAATYAGNEDAGDIAVTVTRSGGSDGAASVQISDAGSGSATSGDDYAAITPTTLSWDDGDASSRTFTVQVSADGAVEPDETVELMLGNASGATLGTPATTTVTIVNDDAADSPGTLSFSATDYRVAENVTGGNATVTVTRTGGDAGAVTVDYATSDGTASAGSDYTAVTSTLSWADGVSGDQTFLIPVIDDTIVEPDETVDLSLSNATGGATLGTASATLTIVNDDVAGALQFAATSFNVGEGDGTIDSVICVQRVAGASGAVSVEVTDAGTGTATGGGTDYTFPSPTTVNWADGDTADKCITLTLIDDSAVEGNETIVLSLANAGGGASIGSPASVTVNIADDDAPSAAGELQFDTASYTVAENGVSVTLTVNRINGSTGAVTVDYATSDGTASAGSDYAAASGTLTWADGQGGAQTFTVTISDDTSAESAESFTVALSNVSGGASLASPSIASVTILDDENPNLTMILGSTVDWVAFQDGPAGAWVEWKPSSGNTYQFKVTDAQGRYGVAFHRQEVGGIYTAEKVYVIHATLGELSAMEVFPNPLYAVSGTLSNYSAGNDSAAVVMHVREAGGEPLALPYDYSLPVPAGNRDLLAFEWDWGTGSPGNFVLRRDLAISGDLANQDVDFSTGTPLAFNVHTFGGDTSGQGLEVYYATANGTVAALMSEVYDGINPVEYFYVTNSELTQAGDAYSFQISEDLGASGMIRVRNQSASSDPGNVSMNLANLNPLGATTVTASETTGLSYTPSPASFNGSPVFRAFQIGLDQTTAFLGAHWQIRISGGWLGSSTTYAHPDLASVSGFDADWDLVPGRQTEAEVVAVTTDSATSLETVFRKSMGADSLGLPSSLQVIQKQLAQDNTLKVDAAINFHSFTW